MADIELKQGDLGPPAVLTLTDSTGAAIDISSASALRVSMVRHSVNREPRFQDRTADSMQSGVSPNFVNKGMIRYNWQAGDTGAPGDYLLEAEAVFSGSEQTHPGRGYLTVRIDPSLG